MTKFVRKNFTKDGPYCMYDGKFVARFKRGGRADFLSFLVKNFTVEEYFELMANPTASPLGILETKGYVSPRLRGTRFEGMKLGLPTNKSELVRAAAVRLGYPVIEIGLVESDQERASRQVLALRMDVV